jgi:hypothetical protein
VVLVAAEDWVDVGYAEDEEPQCTGPCFSLGNLVRVPEGVGVVRWVGESKVYPGTCRIGVVIAEDMFFVGCSVTEIRSVALECRE